MVIKSLFYALVIVGGLIVAELELRSGRMQGFWITNAMVVVALALEISIGAMSSRARLRNRNSLLDFDDYSKTGQITNHLLIPFSLYAAAGGFLYFFGNTAVGLTTFGLLVVIYTVLFLHLAAYFERDDRLLRHTHQAYDIAKLAIVFFTSAFMWQIGLNTNRLPLAIVAIALINLGALLLTLMRYRKLALRGIIISIITTIIGIIGLTLAVYVGLSALQLALLVALVYYAVIASMQHYLDNELHFGLILEYTLVIVLVSTIILGLNS